MQDWRRHRGLFALFWGVPTLWLVILFIVPMGIVWLYSFGTNVNGIDVRIDGNLANYAHTLSPLYLGIFFKSAAIAALTTLICLVIGFPVALAIVFSPEKYRGFMLLAIMLPFWTNMLIRTYALIALMRTKGYINISLGWLYDRLSALMAMIGSGPFHPFVPLDLLYTNFAVLIGLVFVSLPFMVLPLYSALDRLDRSLIEASLDLGAGHFRTIVLIVAPLAMPGIISGVIITFVPALGAFLQPDLLGGSNSDLIANVIERQFKSANDWPFGSALSFMLMYVTFIAIAVQTMRARKQERER